MFFVVCLLIAMDAFVPRSRNMSFGFHVCEFVVGMLISALAWRVLVAVFKRHDKKVGDDVRQNQFGCCFAIAILGGLLIIAVVVILYAVHDYADCKRADSSNFESVSQHQARVQAKALARSSHTDRQFLPITTFSDAISFVCGLDVLFASCYDVRNDALRSISRRRDLSADEVAAMMEYVASTNYVMRIEREAALKNDVLNLLRNQKQPPKDLADLLLDMVASKQYAPVIIDYCIQHLGAMVGSVPDDTTKARIREAFVAAAEDIGEAYSGTALYSLAEMPNKSKSESDELRRLTVAACGESANPIARISAIQLAGERGYCETLPMLRGILAGTRRDAVLDMTVVGSIGLMGDANDVQLLESFRSRGGRRLKPAIDAAVQRTKERHSANQTKR